MAMASKSQKRKKTEKGLTVAFPEQSAVTPLGMKTAEIAIHTFFTFLFYLAVIVIISMCGNRVYQMSYAVFGQAAKERPPGTQVNIVIKPDESTWDIAKKLEREGVISYAASFYIRCRLSLQAEQTIIPGSYCLSTADDCGEIVDCFTNTKKEE